MLKLNVDEDEDELGDDEEEEEEREGGNSSDDEAGYGDMEVNGVIDEDMEAEQFGGAAAQQQEEGPEGVIGADDGAEIGVAEARLEVRNQQEIEEAKAELEDLKGSDEEGAGA